LIDLPEKRIIQHSGTSGKPVLPDRTRRAVISPSPSL
jgi:hypothetical protein